jgi:hypothetical protein
MKKPLLTAVALTLCGFALAKLPPPDPATKPKADEAKAKTAWDAKVDAYQLCRVQERVVAFYRKTSAGKADGAAPPAPAAPTAPGGAKPTPAVASAPMNCVDPGPFAYNPPEQKPLESSGAHSPTGTAASPPGVRAESGTMQAPKK